MSDLANPLQPPQPPAPTNAPNVPVAPAAAPTVSNPINQAVISRALRGRSQEHVLRRRDAAGDEMAMFAKVVNDPNPDPKEVQNYIVKLLRMGHIQAQEAGQLLASMPRDPAALRAWARTMFSAIMHEGIHAEAAFPKSIFPSETAAASADGGNK